MYLELEMLEEMSDTIVLLGFVSAASIVPDLHRRSLAWQLLGDNSHSIRQGGYGRARIRRERGGRRLPANRL